MKQVKVNAILVLKNTDWATGKRKETTVEIIVDEDKVHEASRMRIENLSEVARKASERKSKAAYKLVAVGSTVMLSGENSIPNYLYGIPSGTRRIKGAAENDYTRAAYGI